MNTTTLVLALQTIIAAYIISLRSGWQIVEQTNQTCMMMEQQIDTWAATRPEIE